MSIFGGGGGSSIPAPAPVKRAPVRVEPNLDRARAKMDIRSRQRRSLAVNRPLGEPTVRRITLG